jgi:4-hydroxy-3-methylbut-2-enyl diphosphate reductase
MIDNPSEIDFSWFDKVSSVGICGATSTPKWLMEDCRDMIIKHFNF